MHYFPLMYASFSSAAMPFLPSFLVPVLPFLPLIILWSIIIKGCALWHAARGGQVAWFVALLVVNTLGILEIIYLIWFRPMKSDTVSSASPKLFK